ncbi:MAG: DUF547 domain-containing protein [Plectolyngbya sp. WJT66-NPBG17]|jgi:hypothetical protein|nr:DUF547 domain-containing protein [Plectolyngbya sp. WJT66-NPBG17]
MDFEPWNELLQTYVNDRGKVDYARWKQEQPNAISEWIASLNWNDPAPEEQLSLWINLYNAFVIEKILPRYPLRSIQPKILGIPNWVAFFQFFFNRDRTAFNQAFSLGQIENEFLRKQFQDPRIHFAIVCASIGCPLLRNEAYFPERVYQQLEDDKTRFIQDPDKVKQDRDVLYCSKIFKWYRQDFLAVAPSIPEYINPEIAKDIRVSHLDYDWSLNQAATS